MKKINTCVVIFVLTIFSSFGQGGWTTENLSNFKMGIGAAQLGSKVYFGGGYTTEGVTDLVEIYDINTDNWTYLHLSVARDFTATISNGSKIFFAGGMVIGNSTVNTIDIYDTILHEWRFAQLSSAVFALSAVSKGNKVLFAGGGDYTLETESDMVDIYNADTEEWTTALLSEARAAMGAGVVGDLAFFAGGLAFSNTTVTDKVDIYNFSTGEWTMDRLSEARFNIATTTVGDKIIFAGGEHADGLLSKRVDIYDYATKTWSIDSLSVARPFAGAATVCGKAYFVGGMALNPATNVIIGDFDEIDIYDDATGTWSVEYLPYNLFAHATISVGDKLLIAGGGTISGQFIQLRDVVRIFTCTTVNTRELQYKSDLFTIKPNPAIGNFYIALIDVDGSADVTITDMTGNVVYRTTTMDNREIEINTNDFAEGVYIVQIQSADFIQSQKVIIVK